MSAGICYLLITKFWRHSAHFVFFLHRDVRRIYQNFKNWQNRLVDARTEQL